MSTFSRREKTLVALCLLVSLNCAALTLTAALPLPPPPPVPANTIEHGRGVNMPTVNAWDYFYRDYNVTAFFEVLAGWMVNHTLPQPVWEETVEWGTAYGTTGDWFNHTLPGEPEAIFLQMHPTNNTYDGVLVYPVVYDKTDTQWQLGLYWFNGTQITDSTDMLVMYHLRWEAGPD